MSAATPSELGPIAREYLDNFGIDAGLVVEVFDERARQDKKWGEQNHPDGTGDDVRLLGEVELPTYGTLAFLTKHFVDLRAKTGVPLFAPILLEEAFEAVSATSESELRTELIQVAAVAVQWVQAIDRRRAIRECRGDDQCPATAHIEGCFGDRS